MEPFFGSSAQYSSKYTYIYIYVLHEIYADKIQGAPNRDENVHNLPFDLR